MTNLSIWTISNPAYDTLLRKAAEDRSFAIYTRFKPLRAVFGWGIDAVFRVFSALNQAIATRVERTETLAALRDLDDRQLADIGLDRADIEALAVGRPIGDVAATAELRAEPASAPVAALPVRPARRPLAFTVRDTLELDRPEQAPRRAA